MADAKGHKKSQERLDQKYGELDATDKSILRYVITHPGITDAEIGELVGLERRRVNVRRNAPKFRAAHDEYLKEPLEVIRASLKKAARVIVATLNTTDERLRFLAAKTILASEGILNRQSQDEQEIPPCRAVSVIYRIDENGQRCGEEILGTNQSIAEYLKTNNPDSAAQSNDEST